MEDERESCDTRPVKEEAEGMQMLDLHDDEGDGFVWKERLKNQIYRRRGWQLVHTGKGFCPHISLVVVEIALYNYKKYLCGITRNKFARI